MTNSNKSGKVTRVASRFWIFGNSSNEGPAGSEASSSNRLPQSSSKFAKVSSTFWSKLTSQRFPRGEEEDKKEPEGEDRSNWLTKTKSFVSAITLKLMRKQVGSPALSPPYMHALYNIVQHCTTYIPLHSEHGPLSNTELAPFGMALYT